MPRISRLVAAALLIAGVAAVGAVSGRSAPRATATLQVVPRGPGAVEASPTGTDATTGTAATAPCDDNSEPGECRWAFPAGSRVTLTARPTAGASFVGWNSPDCPGTAPCQVTLDADVTSVIALFSPLRVRVLNPAAGRITGTGGIDCPGTACNASFPARSQVTLTYSGPGFQRWEFGCLPADRPTCTVDVLHQPTWVGVKVQGEAAPQHPDVVSVRFLVRKAGSGSGRVTGLQSIDCGTNCAVDVSEEGSVTLAARPDGGSLLRGWGGVCKADASSCSVAVAAFSSVQVTFARDEPPATPGGLAVILRARTSLTVGWQQAADDVGIAGYEAALDGAAPRSLPAGAATASFEALACRTTHTVTVVAIDTAGNRSAPASLATATSACPLSVGVASVAVVRLAGARQVVARLRATSATTGRIALYRGSRLVASQRLSPRAGVFRLRLRIPRAEPRGPHLLRIELADGEGGSFRLERTVRVP